MPHEPAAERLDELERKVDLLETVPTRMTDLEGQIVQLRGELHDGFSAIRTELRGEMQGIATGVLGEMHAIADDLRAEMHALHRATLEAIKAGDEETRCQMRVLFEEAISRIATIGEALKPRRTP